MTRKLILILTAGLVICLLGTITALAQAQSQYATVKQYEKATGKKIAKFSEAPVLRTKVAAGKLPPVEKRLPEEPAVVVPVEEIGQYGGTWHRVATRVWDTLLSSRLGYEPLVRRARDAKTIIPNVAKSWKISDGGKVFTFYLRKGMKWSDGHPFTADDIIFWYEDMLLNKELTPAFPKWLTIGREPAKIEKVDDYTIRFRFAQPHALFLDYLTFRGVNIFYPKHYLKQFHPRYTSKEKLEKKVKQEGYEFWYQLFQVKSDVCQNPELPTIRSWKLKTAPPANRLVTERNPYYWKVDPAGNQLPYIDRIAFDMVESAEIANFKAIAGELDMHSRYMSFANYTLFMKNREKGDYRVIRWVNPIPDVLNINQNCKDPVLRKLFENRKFRIALSLAINREEISELCYLGVAEPWGALPCESDPYYVKPRYLEYNPEKANELLDEIGLTKRNNEGYRLRPDGKVLSVTIETYGAEEAGGAADEYQLIKEYWEKIGIKTAIKVEQRNLWESRRAAGEMQICAYLTAGIHWVVDPSWYVPTLRTSAYAPLYGLWYETGGKGGEKPTGELRRLQELYDKMKVTIDEKERTKLGKEIIRSHAENVWVIGIVRYPALCIVKNNFRNVPEDGIQSYRLMTPGYLNPEQFFIKQK